jgi:hypothetical protein
MHDACQESRRTRLLSPFSLYISFFHTHPRCLSTYKPVSCFLPVPDQVEGQPLDAFTILDLLFICDLGTNFHPTMASISFLHLFWISIDSKKILYFASSSFFSLFPAVGCTTVAGGVISCMISQSAFAGSRGWSRIAAKRPNIAAPSTTDVACECGSITGMLHVFASRRMSAIF